MRWRRGWWKGDLLDGGGSLFYYHEPEHRRRRGRSGRAEDHDGAGSFNSYSPSCSHIGARREALRLQMIFTGFSLI